MSKKPKILIGIPCIDGKVPIEMINFLFNMETDWVEIGYAFIKRVMIHYARSAIMKQAIDWWYDYLFFLDDDNPPDRTDVLDLLLEDLQDNPDMKIISWLYRMRQKPHKLTIFWETVDENWFRQYVNLEKVDASKWDIIEVANIPTWCVLIDISVCKEMMEKYKDEPFECKTVLYVKVWEEWEEFSPDRLNEYTKNEQVLFATRAMGEDILFFERCRTAGYRLYVDCRATCRHLSHPQLIPVWEDTFIR